MRLVGTLIALVIILGVVFSAFSFGALSVNPAEWSELARFGFAAITLILLVLSVRVYDEG